MLPHGWSHKMNSYDILTNMLLLSWIFIGCGVWVVLMGAMILHYLAEDINEREYIKLYYKH